MCDDAFTPRPLCNRRSREVAALRTALLRVHRARRKRHRCQERALSRADLLLDELQHELSPTRLEVKEIALADHGEQRPVAGRILAAVRVKPAVVLDEQ